MSRRIESAECRPAPGGFPGDTWTSQTPTSRGLLANKKPGRNNRAGFTCPRPFSSMFYVASKPAGSNDHEIDVVIRAARLPVKAAGRLPMRQPDLRPHPEEPAEGGHLEGWATRTARPHPSRRPLRGLLR